MWILASVLFRGNDEPCEGFTLRCDKERRELVSQVGGGRLFYGLGRGEDGVTLLTRGDDDHQTTRLDTVYRVA